MAYTQADLDAIDRAVISGHLRIQQSDGSSIMYRSMDDMLRARALIAADLAAQANGGVRRGRVSYVSFSQGGRGARTDWS